MKKNNSNINKAVVPIVDTTISSFYYLKDIKKYKVLSKEEEDELFKAVKNGDEDAKDKIINSHQRFIYSLAKRYATDDRVMDLVNEGNIALIEAINSYEPQVGVRFLSYAVWFIRRNMNAFVMNGDMLIKKSNYRKTTYKITKYKNKYFAQNGVYPTEGEIIDMLKNEYNMDIKNYGDVLDLSISSVSTSYNDDDKSAFENTPIFVNKTSIDNAYDDASSIEYDNEIINHLIKRLNDREKKIILMSYGIGYEYPIHVDDIGEMLNLTTERVRQIKKTAIEKMRSIAPQISNTQF